ncbi:ORF3 [Halorubrum pleomorphic virus 3]|uniref:ORF3 n=1 Tax=Halorubrum pleomorphic virus 3 TaxID=1156720 RepID=H9ABN2_9VIRU|nr:ORF3 [Halorubrum pleomorphic virus 3]AFD04002.1 ORF3 [Halorubrum pleomorphic virus 3]
MNTIFRITLIGLLGIALAMGMGGAAAQGDGEAVPINVTVEGGETEADTLANQEEIRLEETTTLTGWEFVDGTARIGVEVDRPTRISISDNVAGLGEEGATRIPVVTQRVFPGTTVIAVPVESFAGGNAVSVAAGGEGVRISTAMDESGNDPFRHFGGESGLFSGMLLALVSAVGGAGWVLRREDKGVMEA